MEDPLRARTIYSPRTGPEASARAPKCGENSRRRLFRFHYSATRSTPDQGRVVAPRRFGSNQPQRAQRGPGGYCRCSGTGGTTNRLPWACTLRLKRLLDHEDKTPPRLRFKKAHQAEEPEGREGHGLARTPSRGEFTKTSLLR